MNATTLPREEIKAAAEACTYAHVDGHDFPGAYFAALEDWYRDRIENAILGMELPADEPPCYSEFRYRADLDEGAERDTERAKGLV